MNHIQPIAKYNTIFNKYLPLPLEQKAIYQSDGLIHHIEKRHPDCLKYLQTIPSIIQNPDYIGVNPNESETSFELVKCLDNHVQLGIKLDIKENYLYVATLHTITSSKLQHRIQSGRLKKI